MSLSSFWPLVTLSAIASSSPRQNLCFAVTRTQTAPLQVQFIMPKSAADQMQRQIEYGKQGIDEVIESLSHVDSARATAWKLEDETKVNLEATLKCVSHLMFHWF